MRFDAPTIDEQTNVVCTSTACFPVTPQRANGSRHSVLIAAVQVERAISSLMSLESLHRMLVTLLHVAVHAISAVCLLDSSGLFRQLLRSREKAPFRLRVYATLLLSPGIQRTIQGPQLTLISTLTTPCPPIKS